MRTLSSLLVLTVSATLFGQISMQQRVDDFTYLSSLLNRNYAPYEWKIKVSGFDMLDLEPWLKKVRDAKDDTEFYNICVDYVANLNDYNTFVTLPSDFEAYLGFTADLYDGKAIIESIDRGQLPSSRYAIALGDELLSIDGRSVESLINEYGKFVIDANPKATRRAAVDFLTYRLQAYMPASADIGVTSRVEILKADGSTVKLDLPWSKIGTPMQAGPLPDFTFADSTPFHERFLAQLDRGAQSRRVYRPVSEATETTLPEVQSIGAVSPVYALPANFQTRLGRGRTDTIYSGSYESGGKKIGYLRISNFSNSTTFFTQLDTEVAWLNDNTDVLVLDQMRDRLNSICAAERAAARFTGKPFLQPGFEVRATWTNVLNFELAVESAIDNGADDQTIRGLQSILKDLRAAFAENRGRTGPEPFCGTTIERPAAVDRNGRVISYDKPILLVTDELSSDFFAATIKDAGKATQFGIRTRGSLGTGATLPGPAYTEMTVYVKDSLMTRAAAVKSPGYPDSAYVENTGVHPEIVEEYMTMENYRRRGAPFVESFTKAALGLLQ